jgi:methylenetetrahydrofolate reductase (NADPH)
MGIVQKLTGKECAFSLEFFPPKKDMPMSSVYTAISQLAARRPAFVSVTYGAGGGNRERTLDIVSQADAMGLEAIAHLTCAGSDPDAISDILDTLEKSGVKNVLALRGDVPEGMNPDTAFVHYRHATDLIADIKKRAGFTVAAAAYPEAHVESPSIEQDIEYMKMKAALGVDFFITQLCFDTCAVVEFYERLYKASVTAPVVTGIMPLLNPKQIIRMALLSGCSIPAPLSKIICLYGEKPEEFKKAGLEYAVRQITLLMEYNINKFHLYTMNKADEINQILSHSGLTAN